MKAPTVFLSYSWDDESHDLWVCDLATRLRKEGVETILDQWHARPGDQLPRFMEKAVSENDFVLTICTPKYKAKFDERGKGAGYEGNIIQAEVFVRQNDRKFIPILREGEWNESAPTAFLGKLYIDMRASLVGYESNYRRLVNTLLGRQLEPPPLGVPSLITEPVMETNSNAIITGKIVDCTVLSATFPQMLSQEVPRDAILNLVDDFFSTGIQLVTLEGKADIGKTRIIAQYAMRKPANAISIFLTPASSFIRSPQLLYADLVMQMHWALTKSELADPHSADEALVRRFFFDLHRAAKRANQLYYFLIDGIEDLTENATQFTSMLLAILPIGYPTFRFLLSGDAKWIPSRTLSQMTLKSYPVPGWSVEETISYFAGCNVERTEAEELYNSCSKGCPGFLASARRLIESGVPAAKLIAQLPEQLPTPFHAEWRNSVSEDEILLTLLGVLSHDSNPHSISELADLLSIPAEDVRHRLVNCKFIELPPNDHIPVNFISAAFRRFAADQLHKRREDIWELLVQHFLSHRDNDRALDLLPSYLEQTGRSNELLAVLSLSTFIRLAERTESLAPLQMHSRSGLLTSLELKKPGEALRFGVQSAVVADGSRFSSGKSEMIARLSLGDYDTAVALAQSAALKSQRLQLLASIAKYQQQKGLTAEPAILDSVATLIDQLDVREIGNDLISLASALMFSRPDLAIKLVTRIQPGVSDDRSMDWAFATLSIVAALNRGRNGGAELSSSSDDLRSRINDPAARRFSSAISLLVGNYTVAEILRQVEGLESAGDRIYLLRQWCRNTNAPEKAAKIIDYAVHLAIRTTEYSPTASDFRDLALPLAKVADMLDISPLITAFDIQKEVAKRTGPTQDYIHLQLLLAQAEARTNALHAGQRLLEIYYEVKSIPDLETRIVCTGLIVALSPGIDPTGAFDDSADVRLLTETEFIGEVQELLNDTADHYIITRNIIEAVSKDKPELALEVAYKLNTEPRRDSALEDIAAQILEQPIRNVPLNLLEKIVDSVSDLEIREEIIRDVLVRLGRVNFKAIPTEIIPTLAGWIDRACNLLNPVTACDAMSHALIIFHKVGNELRVDKAAVEASLSRSWQSIDDPSIKIEAGYDIAIALAETSHAVASWYLAAIDEMKMTYVDLTDFMFVGCLRLAIRAFAGLLLKKTESEIDFDKLAALVSRVPSAMVKIRLWSEVALRCYRAERADHGRRIVNQRLKPLLDSLKGHSEYEWIKSLIYASPALYESHSASAMEMLQTLPLYYRDTAFEHIITFKLTKAGNWEPYNVADHGAYDIDIQDCLEILKLSQMLDEDVVVYRQIEAVAKSAIWRQSRHPLTEIQKNQVAQAIRELSAKKFPNVRHIKHEGFAILAEALALRLTREKTADWQPLLRRAREIDNKSDRVFVLACVAENMHSGLVVEKLKLLHEAKDIADTIPSDYDRVERLRSIAMIAQNWDKAFARILIADAMKIIKEGRSVDVDEARRRLVDFAYQIEPALASSLASSLDDDAARQKARARLEYQDLKARLQESSGVLEEADDQRGEQTASVAWELLGQMNANRIQPRSTTEVLKLIEFASGQKLPLAFPVLSWAIESVIVRRAHADESKRLVREMFEATLGASEMAAAIMTRATGKSVRIRSASAPKSHSAIVFSADQRGNALSYLRDWLRDHANEYLKICDPYFGPKDLEILQIIGDVVPDLHVTIVTSRKQQESENIEPPWNEYYARNWAEHFGDQIPPKTEFVIVGGKFGDLPVDDRWWLTCGSGIRLSGSFSSLGVNLDVEIRKLSPAELVAREELTDSYIGRQKREHSGEKLTYQFFEL